MTWANDLQEFLVTILGPFVTVASGVLLATLLLILLAAFLVNLLIERG
jgi:hypothetical protein